MKRLWLWLRCRRRGALAHWALAVAVVAIAFAVLAPSAERDGEPAVGAATSPSPDGGDPAEARPARAGRKRIRDGGADRVEAVIDGDTVVLARLGRARLIGIDTPELRAPAECYGREASARLRQLVPPGTAVVRRFDVERRDRYGRALVYLYRGRAMVNARLVADGYATPMTIPPNVRHAERFVRLAKAARRAGRGLWAAGACDGDADRPATGERARSPSAATGGDGPPAGDRDCAHFSTHAEAQAHFEAKGGPARDPDRLDGDRDGIACETLP